MSPLDRDMLCIILQFLKEGQFKESAHKLEEETGIFFNIQHFEGLIKNGQLNEVEKYLLGFINIDDNSFSTEVLFEIRKQKYLEALYRKDFKKAIDILNNELKVLKRDLDEEMAIFLTPENIREPETRRINLIDKLKNVIESNPLFRDKLDFPAVEASRLTGLITQSLNWQAHVCMNPNAKPEIKTLLVDHRSEESQLNGAQVLPPITNPLTMEVKNMPVNILRAGYGNQSQGQSSNSFDDLPLNVAMTLNQGSSVRSMDFHPIRQTLLLVGTSTGDIIIWDLVKRTSLAKKSFEVADLSAWLKISLRDDTSVNRVLWSPNGSQFAVAYSKNVVHVHTYYEGDDLRNYSEIEAHKGSVNDIAFLYPNDQLSIVTCGDDGLIKVWDALTGIQKYTFEGHESSVYSLCAYGYSQLFFSASTDGRIKGWLCGDKLSRFNFPDGHSSTTLLFSSYRKRLFSCGTDKDGVSQLAEHDYNTGKTKRVYVGLGNQTTEAVKFDTTNDRFLAAGDDFAIKFWDMDSVNLFTTTDAEGGLPARPCVRFNKEGSLLAVSTSENSIKILASAYGSMLLDAKSLVRSCMIHQTCFNSILSPCYRPQKSQCSRYS